jgi:hypothetical protein
MPRARSAKHALRMALSAEWTKFALVITAATGIHWLGGVSERMLEHFIRHGMDWNIVDIEILGAGIFVLTSSWLIWRLSRRHSGVIVRLDRKAGFCPNLIFFLSPPCRPETSTEQRQEVLDCALVDLLDESWLTRFPSNSPWVMPLAAVAWHARLGRAVGRRLQRVYVIPSPETMEHAGRFKELVEAGLRQKDLVVVAPRPTPFGDFHELSEAVDGAIREIEKLEDSRFLVDITSGDKICSVVGAALTFEHGRRIQYVSGGGAEVAEYKLDYLAAEFLKPGA